MSYYILTTTDYADRTFSNKLSGTSYFFRYYYIEGYENWWFLDICDIQQNELAVGRKLVQGSINILAGYANIELYKAALVVGLKHGTVNDDNNGTEKMPLLWMTDAENDQIFKNGDPMDTLYEHFNIADQTVATGRVPRDDIL